MGTSQPVSRLVLAWQETGDERALEHLFAVIAPIVEKVARNVVRSAGIADPGAIDEVTARVFDHIRRLPGARDGECGVEPFRPVDSPVASPTAATLALSIASVASPRAGGPSDTNHRAGSDPVRRLESDPGVGFVRWLAAVRAHDVVRGYRRQARHMKVFSQLRADFVRTLPSMEDPVEEPLADEITRAMTALDPRCRRVVELLLEGETQATIARSMGFCEGTVSRIRGRAIEQLRLQLIGPGDHGPVRRPPK